jgi:hypothetical protein
MMRLKSMVFALAVPALLAYGQAPRSVTAPQRGPAAVPGSEISALSQLIGITGDELRNEHEADTQRCAVPLRPYVSLRLAEKKYHFDRESVLRQMCVRRTTSFALALQSAGGTYGTLTEPGPKQNQDLREAEREFLRQINAALTARPQGR